MKNFSSGAADMFMFKIGQHAEKYREKITSNRI